MLRIYNKPAIVYQGQQYSYEKVLQNAAIFANRFCKNTTPQKVLIFSENSANWIFAFYGSMVCKATMIPVDVQSSLKELSYIIADSYPDIIFTTSDKKEFVKTAVQNSSSSVNCEILTIEDIPLENDTNIVANDIFIDDSERTLFIIYTSGTTGSPKGVELCYRNIMFNINAVSKEIPIFNKERNVMVLLPLHHIFPLLGSVVAPLSVGGTIYIADGLSAENILKTLNEGKINIIIGVPRLYDTLSKGVMSKINANFSTRIIYKIVKLIGSDSLSKIVFKSVHQKFGNHIEYLVCGGAALNIETAKIFKALGFYILDGYGMTETAPMISFTHPGKRKIGYSGYPLTGSEIRFTQYGEICVKGDNVMKGYYNRPEETAEILKDGWLHTGDIGVLNKYGLKITGRIKEIIVTSNGKNINPEEVETDLVSHFNFIKECGVFMYENVLQVVIFPQMTILREQSVENIEKFIKEKIISFNKNYPPYKRLKRVHIASEEMPKTRLGKIQRFKLPALAYKQIQQSSEEIDVNESSVYNMLKTFIEEETGNKAKGNDHFEIDLSMDSLSRVALLAFIENSFELSLSEADLEDMNTLNLLTDYIEKHSQVAQVQHISWKEILSSRINTLKLPKAGFIQRITSYLSKLILNLTYRYRGKGETNIPQEPCIFVANHHSALDAIIITARMKRKASKNTFIFAKEKHWRNKFARFMAGKNNIIIMDINKNVRESLQQMSYVLQQGKNVIIFPEGTRTKDSDIKHFKKTFAILSTELNIPIVPVVIDGSERATYRFIKFPRFLAKIKVEFLSPIYPDPNQSASNLRDNVHQLMQQHLLKNKTK